ncbi:MocR-like pyridoxine biosynthesis transcription factor PdxR [Nitratireductor indicus]|uniref:MocR-like pyridoxine biosynthesis transcription factor PdxR n=1 Tax=Nitratireductor indicus TaxID=721133 RepID=UPI002874670A|nr:PLP-dependent aminotransferase family protein [Nitratireductor indicus]MDS1136726.1 PLP-dependent aminotransferase family protein [Nitratireductor indicus]
MTTLERRGPALSLRLNFDKTKPIPLYEQLRVQLVALLKERQLPPAQRMPSARSLALENGVSRTTVEESYNALVQEGLLVRVPGSGTYVAPVPAGLQYAMKGVQAGIGSGPSSIHHRNCGAPITSLVVETEKFGKDWNLAAKNVLRKFPRRLLEYGDPLGQLGLREQIAHHLAKRRGILCDPEQVVITSGSQQAIYLTLSVLLQARDRIVVEDPCYQNTVDLLRFQKLDIIPVPVDEHGLVVKRAPPAQAVYVTPSFQYPLGVEMSLERRLQLLAWAERNDAWIIEDDYGSESIYQSCPETSLFTLSNSRQVIYMGSFSRTLFPGLRLGYMVLPASMVDAFARLKGLIDRETSGWNQLLLEEFLRNGKIDPYIRRTWKAYDRLRTVFIQAAETHLSDKLVITRKSAGVFATFFLRAHCNDVAIAKHADDSGLLVRALSPCYLTAQPRYGLLVYYHTVCLDTYERQVRGLARRILQCEADGHMG